MNLKELTWPVRLYWDLPPVSSHSLDDMQICEEIIQAKILYLSVRDSASPPSSSCLAILNKLKDNNIAVSLTIASSALTPSMPALLAGAKIKTLLINVVSLHELRSSLRKLDEYKNPALRPGVSFDIGKDNFRDIPEVVSFSLDNGIRDLVFPIQRLTAGRDCFCLNQKDRAELRDKLEGMDFTKLRLTIHDPFLWQVFYPDIDYHEGGCQAANSMLFITPEYKVYPCPALPVELGDLRVLSLREIILSAKKRELRDSLLNLPGQCGVCEQTTKCLGGCRGRAFVLYDSLDRRDPACDE